MALSTVGAWADGGNACAPMRRSISVMTHPISSISHPGSRISHTGNSMCHRGASSGALPFLAMARCVAAERPDLVWSARLVTLNPNPGNLQFFQKPCDLLDLYCFASARGGGNFPIAGGTLGPVDCDFSMSGSLGLIVFSNDTARQLPAKH